jgi:putative membrane protein
MPVSGRDEGDVGSEGSRSNAAMPLTDAQIAGVLDFANNAEIQQAQLAQSKSKDPHVSSVASMMIEQHSRAKQEMAGLGLSSAGSSLLQTLSSEGQRTLATLRDKNGRDFDRAYLQAQVEQHQKLLDTVDRQLLPNAKNTGLRSQLSTLKPTIQRHLQHARDALKALESGAGSDNQQSNTNGSRSSGQRTGTGSATEP